MVCSAELGGVITSGGGFSRHWKRPDYQKSHVERYLNHYSDKLPTASNFFNPKGRAYPDIAVYGTKYVVIMDGEILPTAGTSASTPAMAAMIAMWNDIRLAHNQPPLGFINPLLYQLQKSHPEAFHDVVHGNNRCTVNDAKCCAEGFHAVAGWDAASGLGSPKFMQIAQLIMNSIHQPSLISSPQSFSYLASPLHVPTQLAEVGGGGSGLSMPTATALLLTAVLTCFLTIALIRWFPFAAAAVMGKSRHGYEPISDS